MLCQRVSVIARTREGPEFRTFSIGLVRKQGHFFVAKTDVLSHMCRLRIGIHELRPLNRRYVSNSPDVRCTFDSQELIYDNESILIEKCCGYVGGIWNDPDCG